MIKHPTIKKMHNTMSHKYERCLHIKSGYRTDLLTLYNHGESTVYLGIQYVNYSICPNNYFLALACMFKVICKASSKL